MAETYPGVTHADVHGCTVASRRVIVRPHVVSQLWPLVLVAMPCWYRPCLDARPSGGTGDPHWSGRPTRRRDRQAGSFVLTCYSGVTTIAPIGDDCMICIYWHEAEESICVLMYLFYMGSMVSAD